MARCKTLARLIAALLFLCACARADGVGRAVAAETDEPSVFGALTLAAAQRRAVEDSPDVAAARANVDAAAAALAQARAANGLSAVVGYTELPQSGGPPSVTWAQRLTTYGLQATLGDVATLSPRIVQAAALLRGAEADELVAERTERLKVIGLYFAAVQARAVFSAKTDATISAEVFEDDVRARYSAKRLPYLDLLRAQVSVSKARADGANAAGTDANATDALAREVGLSADDLRELVPDRPPEPDVIDDDRAIARAFAQRPEVRSADLGVKAAQAGLAAARRAVIPPITVTGGYTKGVDIGNPINGASFTASIAIPLGDTEGPNVAAQAAAVRSAVAKRDSVRRALAIEVGAAARTAGEAIIAKTQTAETLEAAGAALRLASDGYRSAAVSGLTITDARAIYDQAVVDDIAAGYAVLQAQAILNVELSP